MEKDFLQLTSSTKADGRPDLVCGPPFVHPDLLKSRKALPLATPTNPGISLPILWFNIFTLPFFFTALAATG